MKTRVSYQHLYWKLKLSPTEMIIHLSDKSTEKWINNDFDNQLNV